MKCGSGQCGACSISFGLLYDETKHASMTSNGCVFFLSEMVYYNTGNELEGGLPLCVKYPKKGLRV